ncbi:unnamed protein product [Adineta steineri]|uniref:Uncharacterized protein n=1 Tax=Adineta steineri TaxID=433720 RepID=A0A819A884_9BILA|nr:unnamed protein product [Adineta steineri]
MIEELLNSIDQDKADDTIKKHIDYLYRTMLPLSNTDNSDTEKIDWLQTQQAMVSTTEILEYLIKLVHQNIKSNP